jgi:outer membrane autotransporter protein
LAIQDATQVVSQRAEKVSQPLQFISPVATASSDARVSGVAAGDDINKYGAWVSPFYGISSQGSRSGQPGYKSSYYGGVFGVDSLINDDTALGLALSYIKTDIKHKNLNSGDRTKADSFIVSAYGTYEITKEWFVQSVATFGHSKIKNREIRTEFGATNIAAASYNATSWGGEILTGYNQKIRENVMMTPLFGLEFNRANGINYKETGTNTQNLAIKRGSINQLEAILGARISAVHAMDIYQKYVTFLPEIHGNVRYGLLDKKLNIDIRQDGVAGPSLVPRTAKQTRMVYNVGGSLTAKYNDQWEYSIGYDARLAEKYVAHQGTLKLRVNF